MCTGPDTTENALGDEQIANMETNQNTETQQNLETVQSKGNMDIAFDGKFGLVEILSKAESRAGVHFVPWSCYAEETLDLCFYWHHPLSGPWDMTFLGHVPGVKVTDFKFSKKK